MKHYIEISMDKYCIQKLKCRCNSCKHNFDDYITLNYELVCFEDSSKKKYFLPTYGKYGYLDLMEKLVEKWDREQNITNIVLREFEIKLREIVPYDNVSIYQRVRCSKCHSSEITVLEREVLENCPIDWIKIDKNKLGLFY